MNKDLTDKEILALGVKTPKIKKRVLFKDYTGTYINLGLTSEDSKLQKKELVAVAKRASELVIKDILRKTQMPKLPHYLKLFLTLIIYAGVADESSGIFCYPDSTEEYKLEEVKYEESKFRITN